MLKYEICSIKYVILLFYIDILNIEEYFTLYLANI